MALLNEQRKTVKCGHLRPAGATEEERLGREIPALFEGRFVESLLGDMRLRKFMRNVLCSASIFSAFVLLF